MDGLQRSTTSFRRQGSSGLIWDDKFLGELNQLQKDEQQKQESQGPQQDNQDKSQPKEAPKLSVNTIERSRSNGGGRGYRTGKVSPAIEPPSPKVSACGFCGGFGKQSKQGQTTKPGTKRRSS